MSKGAIPNFNRVAKIYYQLEKIVYGRDMQQARVCHLPELRNCKSILCVGEGDGRFLTELLKTNPEAQVICVEASPQMIALAKQRIETAGFANRVKFHNLPIEQFESKDHSFDGIITNFFLDMYAGEALINLIQKLNRLVTVEALWLVNDFTVPASGIPRLRAKFLLKIMYLFFRFSSNLRTQRLDNPSPVLKTLEWKFASEKYFSYGFIVSRLWESDPHPEAN